MIPLLTLLMLSISPPGGSAGTSTAGCVPQFAYVSPASVDVDVSARVSDDDVRAFSAILLRGCLAKNAVRARGDLILSTDGTGIGLSRTGYKRYQPSDMFFGYGNESRPIPPRIGNTRAVDDARLGYYTPAPGAVERRVGVWRRNGRSVIACYDVRNGRSGTPKILFTSAERFVSIESMVGLPHGEATIMTLLADRGRANKLAVSFAWYGKGCSSDDAPPVP